MHLTFREARASYNVLSITQQLVSMIRTRLASSEVPVFGSPAPTVAWLLLAHLLLFQLFGSGPAASAKEKMTRQVIQFRGKSRSYYFFAPESSKGKAPAPLLVLFHGSGHNGASLVDAWRSLASREGFVLVAPDSADSQEWNPEKDPPELIRDLVESIEREVVVNPRRIYLFGHSAGAVYALYVSLYESNYFAATAVHAGALMGNDQKVIEGASRRIPIAIWVGSRDQYFPANLVRATGKELQHQGFPVQLTVMPGFDHNYYIHSGEVNQEAWRFLQKQSLASPPQWSPFPRDSH